jgi:hypothetical protein
VTAAAPHVVVDRPVDWLELVISRLRLRAARRAAWLRALWADEAIAADGLPSADAALESVLADRDAPELEAAWVARQGGLAELGDELAAVEAALEGRDSRLAGLVRALSLGFAERDVLEACLASALDPALDRVLAYLQDHSGRGYVSPELVARLYGHGRTLPPAAVANLVAWRLVEVTHGAPSEPDALVLAADMRDWLAGAAPADGVLSGHSRVVPPRTPLRSWPLEEAVAALRAALTAGGGMTRITLVGRPGSGRRTLCAAAAERVGLTALAVNSDLARADGWSELFLRAQRHGHLECAAPVWHGETALRLPWPQDVEPFPIQFLICEPGDAPGPVPEVVEKSFWLGPAPLAERRRLWRELVPRSRGWSRSEVERLARRGAAVGDLAAVAAGGAASAVEADHLLRQAARRRLSGLAELLECPFGWDDLVISDSLRAGLEDLVFEARERGAFWERPEARRLFPQGRGLLALFTGAPGTGKTMAAQVLAGSLGQDLFRIDLAAVVSKYVGETSRNIDRVLARAGPDVVLLFDEADALFAPRTRVSDAHDRYANADTGYLLQAIESYDGVAVLATNRKANIEPAFMRRLRYVLEFPRPGAGARERIWRRLVEALAGDERARTLAPALRELAVGVEATGAQIKLAVLGASFAAGRASEPLGASHLLRALERELVKEGRPPGRREQERLLARVG